MDIKISNANLFKAIFALTLENNIMLKAQNELLISRLNQFESVSENANYQFFQDAGVAAKTQVLNRLYEQYGDFDIKDFL